MESVTRTRYDGRKRGATSIGIGGLPSVGIDT